MIVVGDGGHGRDIAAMIGPEAMVVPHHKTYPHLSGYVVIGINDPHMRSIVAGDLEGCTFGNVGHLAPLAYRGVGTVIGPGCTMLTEVRIGDHTHIGAGCHLTRCALGDFVTVAPGVIICGDVTIGDRTFIGAGAVIKNLVTIGNDVRIGAGAVVVNNIPDGSTVKGVPAR